MPPKRAYQLITLKGVDKLISSYAMLVRLILISSDKLITRNDVNNGGIKICLKNVSNANYIILALILASNAARLIVQPIAMSLVIK